jgi:hypothetical protein
MANKDFKVKNGLDIQSPLPVSMGGTGQTSTTNTLNSLLPVQSGNNNKYLQTDGSNASWSNLPTPTFVQMTTTSVSSNITLSSNNRYLVDTNSARTLTLPASPSGGDEIQIFDIIGLAATNKITVSSNSNKINGVVQDLDIDANNAAVVLIYTGSTYGWRVG